MSDARPAKAVVDQRCICARPGCGQWPEHETDAPRDGIQWSHRQISVEQGLHVVGVRLSPRGAGEGELMVQARGELQVKRYRCYRRASDGHTVYRWGRLNSASLRIFADGSRQVVFEGVPT